MPPVMQLRPRRNNLIRIPRPRIEPEFDDYGWYVIQSD